mmetsp:Transcript_14970/g.41106  ORF Transcript_14970/g.41106 Transcript_14970/m.41106 type:complete len:214 (-) Transcript_14970:19-660(-)
MHHDLGGFGVPRHRGHAIGIARATVFGRIVHDDQVHVETRPAGMLSLHEELRDVATQQSVDAMATQIAVISVVVRDAAFDIPKVQDVDFVGVQRGEHFHFLARPPGNVFPSVQLAMEARWHEDDVHGSPLGTPGGQPATIAMTSVGALLHPPARRAATIPQASAAILPARSVPGLGVIAIVPLMFCEERSILRAVRPRLRYRRVLIRAGTVLV